MSPGRLLIAAGALLLALGILVQFVPQLRLGRLPGDFAFGSGNVRVYIPLATSILLSIALTLILRFVFRR
jgi:DUF2905 family protein